MDDLLRLVFSYLRAMWSYRWLGLVTAWVVGSVGMVFVMLMPDQYQASARIFVDTQSILRPLMSGLAIQPNVDQQINMLSRTLISRPNIEKLIRMADLDLDVKNKQQRDALIDALMADVKLSGGGSNLYYVSYRHEQPGKAQKVVQSMVTMFVESGLGDKRQDADQAKKFIEEQIKAYEAKLLEAENRLKEFKLKNMERPGGGKDYFGSLGEVQGQLQQARLELREATNSREALKRQLLGEDPTVVTDSGLPGLHGASTGSVTGDLDARILEMNSQIDGLLQRYTERHPDIIQLKARIAKLEEEKKTRLEQRKADQEQRKPVAQQGGGMTVANPVYQQLKVALAEAEASVASLTARVAEYESRLEKLRQSARLVPELEAEFAQLNRDYDIHRANYNALVSRRESATMSEEMDATGVAEFRLIDPPRVSPKPVAPNRILLLSGVLGAAVVIGIAVCFLMSQLRPVFHDGRAMRDATGLPVLGSVSMLLSTERKRRERRRDVAFFGGFGALVAAYLAMLAIVMLALRGA